MRNIKLIFLFLNQNICCVYSKEPSQWDGSFEHPQNMLKMMGKKYLRFQNHSYIYVYKSKWMDCHNHNHIPTRANKRTKHKNTRKQANRGSYMFPHVLFNLPNEFGKIDKMRGLASILSFLMTSLMNLIIVYRSMNVSVYLSYDVDILVIVFVTVYYSKSWRHVINIQTKKSRKANYCIEIPQNV